LEPSIEDKRISNHQNTEIDNLGKSKMHPYYQVQEKNSLNTIQHERLERENDDDIE